MISAPANDSRAPFLLEIGTEEIPARFIPASRDELAARFEALATELHLEVADLRVLATPRRLALQVGGLSLRQPDREVVLKGPPVSVAFDGDGNPTKAGEGFARKAGVALEACERVKGDRGEYLEARRVEEGRPAAEVLAERLPGLITGLPFRKVMRWGDLDLEYPRPLQWLVALLGEDVVPVAVGPYAAGRTTRGHRTLSGDARLQISAPDAYVEVLRGGGVMVDQEERRQVIREGLARALANWNPQAELLQDEELLDEVVHLCEHPTPFVGAFDPEYLELPAQVITTALKSHQRYFSIGKRGAEGLLPGFAAARDGGTDHLADVVRGNERVLRARLADALFYWNFDQKQTPDQRVRQLASVTWLEGFGSVLDKSARVRSLCADFWRNGLGDGGEPPADLDRAAELAKSDLVSEMIKDGKEFTKLEGFIGARYAEQAGEKAEVVRAIEHHYAPRSATGDLPADPISATLAVADRLDNVAGCWLAGFAPTGAKDPYALRRQVLGVLRILLDRQARVDLEDMLGQALDLFQPVAGDGTPRDALPELGEFVRRRVERYFVEIDGADPDVVRAVLPVRWTDPVDARAWIAALSRYRDREDFQQLATGFKRCRNILEGKTLPVDELEACRDRWLAGGSGAGGEDLAGLPEAAEQALLQAVAAAAGPVVEAEDRGEYETVFDILSSLGPAIDAFFEQVRVNVDDPDLRTLRWAFLREIHGLFARFADFSAVAPAES